MLIRCPECNGQKYGIYVLFPCELCNNRGVIDDADIAPPPWELAERDRIISENTKIGKYFIENELKHLLASVITRCGFAIDDSVFEEASKSKRVGIIRDYTYSVGPVTFSIEPWIFYQKGMNHELEIVIHPRKYISWSSGKFKRFYRYNSGQLEKIQYYNFSPEDMRRIDQDTSKYVRPRIREVGFGCLIRSEYLNEEYLNTLGYKEHYGNIFD